MYRTLSDTLCLDLVAFLSSIPDTNLHVGPVALSAVTQLLACNLPGFVCHTLTQQRVCCRPLTEAKARAMLAQTGEVQGLWMPTIRTHAYVIYATQEQAQATFTATKDTEWPQGNGGRSACLLHALHIAADC